MGPPTPVSGASDLDFACSLKWLDTGISDDSTTLNIMEALSSNVVIMKVVLLGSEKSGKDDGQWNQAAYESLIKIKETGVEVDFSEEVPPRKTYTYARDFAEEGYDLIWAHGIQFERKILQVAKEYPNTYFALDGNIEKTASNVCQIIQGTYEGFYLLGMIAGPLTKKNKVGVIMGEEISMRAQSCAEATKRGINVTNSSAETSTKFVGDWEDRKAAKRIALSLIDWGADVLVQWTDEAGFGIYDACREKNVYVNGNWIDQYDFAPEVMYCSLITRWGPVLKEALEDIKRNEFKERYWMRLVNGALSLSRYHKFEEIIPKEIRERVEKTKQDIGTEKLRIRGF